MEALEQWVDHDEDNRLCQAAAKRTIRDVVQSCLMLLLLLLLMLLMLGIIEIEDTDKVASESAVAER